MGFIEKRLTCFFVTGVACFDAIFHVSEKCFELQAAFGRNQFHQACAIVHGRDIEFFNDGARCDVVISSAARLLDDLFGCFKAQAAARVDDTERRVVAARTRHGAQVADEGPLHTGEEVSPPAVVAAFENVLRLGRHRQSRKLRQVRNDRTNLLRRGLRQIRCITE